ncbi:hypothetical protein, partial [uncultured Rhodococcus sp.]|uniref:hypothetical protein n=1 Tax=uncultured Rhodococcus sp. TaxID=194249 RepID=UPI0026250C6D
MSDYGSVIGWAALSVSGLLIGAMLGMSGRFGHGTIARVTALGAGLILAAAAVELATRRSASDTDSRPPFFLLSSCDHDLIAELRLELSMSAVCGTISCRRQPTREVSALNRFEARNPIAAVSSKATAGGMSAPFNSALLDALKQRVVIGDGAM